MLTHFARIIAPPHCLVCGREGAAACRSCLARVKIVPAQECICCNNHSGEKRICGSCRRQTGISHALIGAKFDGPIRELIHALKYRRLREASVPLAGIISPLLSPANIDAVTAVPVATNRLRARGYNQAQLIARRVACNLGLPYRPLLYRLRNTQQVGNGRIARQKALENVFMASQKAKTHNVLIVDDVITTGATLSACAQALILAGAASVTVAAAARDE